MKVQVNDFNYYTNGAAYVFYYLNIHNKIVVIGNTSDPLALMKDLALKGFRYNPNL